MSPEAEPSRGYPLVTAVIVAHDGARWLPKMLATLEAQSRLPDRLVAVDTGSTDETRTILAQALGEDAVVTAGRDLGFGAAIALGLRHLDPVMRPDGEHWVWVLHDDMQFHPEALQRLLEATRWDPDIALLGPKVREWPQRKRLLEMGLTVTGTASRFTGVDPGEYDQGQHDVLRYTLAVGSAGLLVRRDVWDRLEGFDPALPMFADDLDLGWRAAKAGLHAAVTPDAVVFHAEAGARGTRSIDAADGRPRRLAREHIVYTVLANCRGWAVVPVGVRLLLGASLRGLALLLLKAPQEAWDEVSAVGVVLSRPGRLLSARRRRRRYPRQRRAPVRRLLAPWWAPYGRGLDLVGQLVTEAVQTVNERNQRNGRELETGPVDEEAQNLSFDPGVFGWLLRLPMGTTTLVLIPLCLIAGGGLLFGSGLLQGGALLPAAPGAADWWHTYTESWHPVALGSEVAAPPYVVVLAAAATLLLGKAWLVIDLLFVFTVPLTALAGYVLFRRLVHVRAVALWAAVMYGLLPVLTGAVSQGRLGTVCAAVVLPLLLRCATAIVDSPSEQGRTRAAIGSGLLLAALASFVPLALPMALLVAAGYWMAHRSDRDLLRRFSIMSSVAVLLLLPWLLHLGVELSAWTSGDAGYDAAVAAGQPSSRLDLALGRPGGPGQAPGWITAGLGVAALVALLRADRRRVVLTAWGVAVVGLAVAALDLHDGAWPGFPVLLVQAAAVVAAAVAADGAMDRLGGASFGWRQPLAVVVALAAAVAPVLGAGWWLFGQDRPLLQRSGPQTLPAFMADAQQTPEAPRTLVMSGDDGALSVHLSRGPGMYVGQDALEPQEPAALGDVAARLVTDPSEADVTALADQGVGFILLSGAGQDAVAAVDGAPGLVRSSAGALPGTAWRVDAPAGAVRAGPAHAPTRAEVLPSSTGSVDTALPPGDGARQLVLGEQVDSGWSATLDGSTLQPQQAPGGVQAFGLPASGGTVVVEHESTRGWWVVMQAFVLLLALVMIGPGRRETHETL